MLRSGEPITFGNPLRVEKTFSTWASCTTDLDRALRISECAQKKIEDIKKDVEKVKERRGYIRAVPNQNPSRQKENEKYKPSKLASKDNVDKKVAKLQQGRGYTQAVPN